MLMRERLLSYMGRQQRSTRFFQWQTPTIARDGDEAHITCISEKGGMVEKASDTDTSPALGAVKATRTIQRRLQFIARRNQLLVGEVAGRDYRATKREPPGLRINWTRRIGDPA